MSLEQRQIARAFQIITQLDELIKKTTAEPLATGEPAESVQLGRLQIIDELTAILDSRVVSKNHKYNHVYTIAFEIESDHPGEMVPKEEILSGLLRRVVNLMNNSDEILEACGMPSDTYENDEENAD